jgi:hypothetical protein
LSDPTRFQLELYADLAPLGRPKAFQVTIAHGESGFPDGLYVTTGPAGDDRSDRLLYLDATRQIHVLAEGLHSNETMVFARGPYGEGILISEPLDQSIVRLLPDGSLSLFAEVGTEPFGPAGLSYGPDPQGDLAEALYAVDFSGGEIQRLSPDGSADRFGGGGFGGGGASGKWLLPDVAGVYGGGFLLSLFNTAEDSPGSGAVLTLSPEAEALGTLADGLNGPELLAFGPGGAFGSDLYVPTIGGADNHDGVLYTLSADGVLSSFLTGVDAVSVGFDTENVLGGGMFVADINDRLGAGKIWRITAN